MKTKKYILTPTGEVRPPKCYEYYLYNGNPKMAAWNYENGYPILKLGIVEEEWMPKENETAWYPRLYTKEVAELFWSGSKMNRNMLELGLIFPTKELAEIRLKEVLNFLKVSKK